MSGHIAYLALVVLLVVGPARAAEIPIANPSFEHTQIPDGDFTVDGVGLAGWTNDGGQCGLFNPSTQFPLGVPDGNQTAWTNGPTIGQQLLTPLAAGRYTLRVWVGDSLNTPFGGYSVRLMAGEDWVLAQEVNLLQPPDGGFVQVEVAFEAEFDHPALGQFLRIQLTSDTTQANFDMVTLEYQCLTDLDGDDMTGTTDLLMMLATWGPCPGCPTDLDGDDVVGTTDLLALLSGWGPCL